MRYHYSRYGITGPKFDVQNSIRGPEMPEPMRESPHEDAGELISGIIGDAQAIGGQLMDMLDGPVQSTLHIEGPHRIVDNLADMTSGLLRNTINNVLSVGSTGL